jgi:hypothetical protein
VCRPACSACPSSIALLLSSHVWRHQDSLSPNPLWSPTGRFVTNLALSFAALAASFRATLFLSSSCQAAKSFFIFSCTSSLLRGLKKRVMVAALLPDAMAVRRPEGRQPQYPIPSSHKLNQQNTPSCQQRSSDSGSGTDHRKNWRQNPKLNG